MNQDLNQLRVFVEVVRQGGFAPAARALNMPRSTVSRWIRELEKNLGVRLLQRTTRRVELTEVGDGFFARARLAVEKAEQAHAWVQSRAEAPQGTLRVTTFQLFAGTLLGPVVVSYLDENPGMSVQVVINERNVDLIEEHIDVAIRIGEMRDSSLVIRKLAQMEGWLVASPAYVDKHGAPKDPRELAHHSNMIYGHEQTATTLSFARGAKKIDVSLPGRCVANSIELVRQVTLGGMVIGVLPPMMAHDAIADRRLVRVLPKWSIGSLPIYAAYPSRKHLPQKVRAFVDLLAAQITSPVVRKARV